jgi:hypothetical protein
MSDIIESIGGDRSIAEQIEAKDYVRSEGSAFPPNIAQLQPQNSVNSAFIHISPFQEGEQWQVEFHVTMGPVSNVHFSWTTDDADVAHAVEQLWRDNDVTDWRDRLISIVAVLAGWEAEE